MTDDRAEPGAACDVAIVGAGAAGLATACFAAAAPSLRVLLLDGASRPGAKILVSGGGRCNVTNIEVSERDFRGGKPAIIRQVLRGFPVPQTVGWFQSLGVSLHEEPGGKLFPNTNRARGVLDALLRAVESSRVRLLPSCRVQAVSRLEHGGFTLSTSHGLVHAANVVLATGGRSLPKSGSDGHGYELARAFGHTIVPTTPALVPLVLDGDRHTLHRDLSGISLPVELTMRVEGTVTRRVTGAMLWTHFGISGPAVLDISRDWARARIDQRSGALSANFLPGLTFDAVETEWIAATRARPTLSVKSRLAALLPDAMGGSLLRVIGIEPSSQLATLTREHRRALLHALVEWPLPVTETRGYNFAEVTAGGVSLAEIDPSTMGSRKCPGLYLVGEILDVDGRIGGFNFQWAWASGRVCGAALARSA